MLPKQKYDSVEVLRDIVKKNFVEGITLSEDTSKFIEVMSAFNEYEKWNEKKLKGIGGVLKMIKNRHSAEHAIKSDFPFYIALAYRIYK